MVDIVLNVLNIVFCFGVLLYVIGLDIGFKIDGQNMFIWLGERFLFGCYIVVTRVLYYLNYIVKVIYSIIKPFMNWVYNKIWEEDK